MKIFLPSGFNVNLKTLLQRCGYAAQVHHRTGRVHFIRRLTSDYYPHFHIYVEKDHEAKDYLSLHLDQKRPSYPKTHAHSGEYDSPIVMNEANRIKQFIYQAHSASKVSEIEKKEPFLKRLFSRD